MSWYTAIFPDREEFSHEGYKDISEIVQKISEINEKKEKVWSRVAGCVFMTPYAEEGKNRVDTMIDILDVYWDEYVSLSDEENRLDVVKTLWEEEIEHERLMEKYPYSSSNLDWFCTEELEEMEKEGGKEYELMYKWCAEKWRPSYSVNHFEYGSYPEEGVSETRKIIGSIYRKLAELASSSVDACDTESDTISQFVVTLKNELDSELFNRMFSDLCVKYWDTHKEG